MKFFYQISCYTEHGYKWDVVWKGIIEAEDKKKAKIKLNNLFDSDLKEKVSRGKEKPEFRLFLIDLTKDWEEFWCSIRACEVCKTSYSIIESYQAGNSASKECCSDDCRAALRKPFTPEFLEEGYGNVKPCIYKITNKKTQMSYVGKTIRPFTLRWWNHFYHPGDTKFHKAIVDSNLTDWTFEVIEVINLAPNSTSKETHREILAREQYWITKLDTIENGYNSVVSLNLDKDQEGE